MTGGLILRRVELVFGERMVVRVPDLAVRPGQVATVMGPSGAGKSTLLAFICGTLQAGLTASGEVRLNGRDITALPPERRGVGILFQDDLLFPHLSVGDNLAFAVPPEVTGRRARRQRVETALVEADLAGFARRDPATLSGGQRARVALMRTLLAEPHALLLDEPFDKLDRPLRARFRQMVFDHARRRQLPTLMVSHDPADAEAADGPMVQLDAHDDPVMTNGF